MTEDSHGRPGAAGSVHLAVLAAMGPTVATVLPNFLLAAMAVQMRADLGFDEGGLGATASLRAAVSAVGALALGRAIERMGAGRTLRWGSLLAATAMLGTAAFAQDWVTLTALVALTGVAMSVVYPAADLWVVRTVPHGRTGLAFGLKQSSPQIAVMTAGLAVPVIALSLGWRWTWALGGLFALTVAALVPAHRVPPVRHAGPVRKGDVSLGPMAVLATAVGMSSAAVQSLVTFLVSGGVAAGLTESHAGVLFALCGVGGIIVRIVLGHVADRGDRKLLVSVGFLFAAGALSIALLALQTPAIYLIAGPLAFATAWGWPGLLVLAVARLNPNAPGAAAAIAATGGFTGGVFGPLVFGGLARSGYATPWLVAAGMMLAAALVTALAIRMIRRELRARAALSTD